MRIIGYGICGSNEKYIKKTLDCFKKLCDETIICLNHGTPKDKRLIESYGFKWIEDNREWGKYQNRIKEDFVSKHVANFGGHAYLTLDMDECFSEDFERRDLEQLTKWHSSAFYFIQYWNDEKYYNPNLGFWSVRFWVERNKGYKFSPLPLHCGSVPQWAVNNCSYAPHIIKHYGLMDKEDRMRKVERYKKYDPDNKIIGNWYKNLSNSVEGKLFKEEEFKKQLIKEVATYGDQLKTIMEEKPKKYWLVKNPHGIVIDIPDEDLSNTLRRKGFELMSDEPLLEIGKGVKTVSIVDAREKIEDTMVIKESENAKSNACEICGFIAKNLYGLKVHVRKHK